MSNDKASLNMIYALAQNTKYEEPGYTAYDYEDGKITRKVAVTPKKFSTDLPGKYTITYSITNSKGVTAKNVRIINVVESKSNLEITVTNSNNGFVKNNPIIISVSGSGFNYMIKPLESQGFYWCGSIILTFLVKIVEKCLNFVLEYG